MHIDARIALALRDRDFWSTWRDCDHSQFDAVFLANAAASGMRQNFGGERIRGILRNDETDAAICHGVLVVARRCTNLYCMESVRRACQTTCSAALLPITRF
jgi:hypothetical protein